MANFFIYIWLIAAAVVGYGAALFFAFFALDDPRIKGVMTYVVYLIAWVILGTMFSLVALLAVPALILFGLMGFISDAIHKLR